MGAGAGSIVHPFVQTAASGIHEEVADGGQFKAQLLRDGELHLLGGALVLLKDGQQGAPLQVSEDQPRLLWCVVALFGRVLLLPFACYRRGKKGERRRRRRNGKEDKMADSIIAFCHHFYERLISETTQISHTTKIFPQCVSYKTKLFPVLIKAVKKI